MSLWQSKTEEERTAILQSVALDKHLTFDKLKKRIKKLEEKFRYSE